MRKVKKGIFIGSIKVLASGYNVERFMHLCTKHDIRLWNMEPLAPYKFLFSMYLSDFISLRPLCRKTKTRIRIVEKAGIPFHLKKYANRSLFLIFFIAMVLGIKLLSTYIWNIQIVGNSYLSDENIKRFLVEQGVASGIKSDLIDTEQIELLLRNAYSQITWTDVSIKGTSLFVHIKEQLKSDWNISENKEQPCNLIASKNAEIASIITRNGKPCVVKGDQVKCGDILVLSETQLLDDNGEVVDFLYQHADADVMGYVTYYFSESIPISSIIHLPTEDKKKSYFIQMDSLRLLFPNSKACYEEYYAIEKRYQLSLWDSFYLPIYFGTKTYMKCENAYRTNAFSHAKEIAKTDFVNFMDELLENGVSIIDKNVMIREAGANYEVKGEIYALEPIMVEAPIMIPPNYEEDLILNEHE